MAAQRRAHSSKAELETRLDELETWLAQRLSRSEIVKLCIEKWKVSERHADRYISDATERWRTRMEPDREENRRKHVASLDVALREAFRTHRLREIAPLVKLQASLDGSAPAPLCSQPAAQASPQPEAEITNEEADRELAAYLRALAYQAEAGKPASDELKKAARLLADAQVNTDEAAKPQN